MSTPVKIWVSFLLLAVGAYGGYLFYKSRNTDAPIRNYGEQPAQLAGFEVGDFALTERSGQEFHTSDMKGQVWVVSFFSSPLDYTLNADSLVLRNDHGTVTFKPATS